MPYYNRDPRRDHDFDNHPHDDDDGDSDGRNDRFKPPPKTVGIALEGLEDLGL